MSWEWHAGPTKKKYHYEITRLQFHPPVHVSDAPGLPLVNQAIGSHKGICQRGLAMVHMCHDTQVTDVCWVAHEPGHPLATTATAAACHHPACTYQSVFY